MGKDWWCDDQRPWSLLCKMEPLDVLTLDTLNSLPLIPLAEGPRSRTNSPVERGEGVEACAGLGDARGAEDEGRQPVRHVEQVDKDAAGIVSVHNKESGRGSQPKQAATINGKGKKSSDRSMGSATTLFRDISIRG